MYRFAFAALAALTATAGLAAEPSSGTLTIHETELTYGNGPVVGVNPTPFIGDPVEPTCSVSGVDCDTFALTVDVPDDLSSVFPTAILRLRIDWEHPSGEAIEDYDFYAYDENGVLLGSSEDLNTAANTTESIVLPVRGGRQDIRLDILYFAVLGSTYVGTATLDLGLPSPDADVDAFFEANPPSSGLFLPADMAPETAARVAGGTAGGALGPLLLLLLGLRASRRLSSAPSAARTGTPGAAA